MLRPGNGPSPRHQSLPAGADMRRLGGKETCGADPAAAHVGRPSARSGKPHLLKRSSDITRRSGQRHRLAIPLAAAAGVTREAQEGAGPGFGTPRTAPTNGMRASQVSQRGGLVYNKNPEQPMTGRKPPQPWKGRGSREGRRMPKATHRHAAGPWNSSGKQKGSSEA
jgi:hypothetical protein